MTNEELKLECLRLAGDLAPAQKMFLWIRDLGEFAPVKGVTAVNPGEDPIAWIDKQLENRPGVVR